LSIHHSGTLGAPEMKVALPGAEAIPATSTIRFDTETAINAERKDQLEGIKQ